MQNSSLPLVVEIKRGSHEDGPGIRSVVFFKGCPLRCVFCHSPETQEAGAEIIFSAQKCTHSGECANVCSEGAINLSWPERIDRTKCTGCGHCVEVCSGGGLALIGRRYSIEELVEILLRDSSFYRYSNGGVTLSGGECTLYPQYLESLMKRLKAEQIHLVLETCGYFNYDVFRQKILPYIDLVYFDLKIADAELHRKHTGRDNRRILSNLYRLLQERPSAVQPRVPLVPGITATRENLSAIVDLLCSAGAQSVSLLPYNPLGIEMAGRLGRRKPVLPERFMTPDEEIAVHNMFREIVREKESTGASLPVRMAVKPH